MSSNVTRWRRYVGDTDAINMELTGPENLDGATTLQAFAIKSGVTTLIGPAVVTNSTERMVSINLSTWLEGRAVGLYEMRVVVDDLTWPDTGRAEIEVIATPAVT